MNVSSEIVVIGSGPAGMAAAICAAEAGKRIALVDDNPGPGGQIWRADIGSNKIKNGKEADWFKRLEASSQSVTLMYGWRIIDQPAPRTLLAERSDGATCTICYDKLIIATGAREAFLPFPGWTLPNVMGAGALQAMVKSGLPVKDKRVVIAGTGPLLLAVAANLKRAGAKVLALCEQAQWVRLASFGAAIATDPEKLLQALHYGRETLGIPLHTGCWPVAATGKDSLSSVTLTQGRKQWEVACDYLACGFHLIPNRELAALLGCCLRDEAVVVDEMQRTSLPDVFCAGEPTGIGGVELSLLEGQIAGFAAADLTDKARLLFGSRVKARRFSARLAKTFTLRPELRTLALPDTIICRCEDVPLRVLEQYASWRSAKLHTRCGMGPCQGRICGPATQFLFGWDRDSVRPPLFPARLSSLSFTGQEKPNVNSEYQHLSSVSMEAK